MRSLYPFGIAAALLACDNGFVPSPFASGGGEDAGAGAGPDAATGMPLTPEPLEIPGEALGGPCVDDAQCDDGIACTTGVCDGELGLCRFTSDDAACADGSFCNGAERCHVRLGCQPGPPTSCSDSTPCTIDVCDEATRSCVRTPRDADQDGDVDRNCALGADCDDLDPAVSSLASEVCGNGRDDDCDGSADEAECGRPEFDTCAAPLEVTAPGSYVLTPAGAALDYGAPCAPDGTGVRDLALLVSVPDAGTDVDIVARSLAGRLALARAPSCGAAEGDLDCLLGAELRNGDSVGRLRLRALPAGVYPVYVFTDADTPIQLDVAHEPAVELGDNVECAAAEPIAAGASVVADLAFTGEPIESACPTGRGERFYSFTLEASADVRLLAESLDGLGEPRVSLRSADCADADAELLCAQRVGRALRARSLPAGDYVVAVSASGPSAVALTFEVLPPTAGPAGDQCAGAPVLVAGQSETLDFSELSDDIEAGCSPGFLDAARTLSLEAASDVLIVGRFSPGDAGAVALGGEACVSDSVLACGLTGTAPARVSRRALPAGEYRVIAEAFNGLPATLTAAVRPTVATTVIPGADDCSNALRIDAGGGFFQGNTQNASNDFSASCDFATPNGAPDQLLRLTLEAPRRVLFDMRGSEFDTLLNVRRGPACPGEEVASGCSVVGDARSYLDLSLPAGEYFIQVDGYAGAAGAWFLDVFVIDP